MQHGGEGSNCSVWFGMCRSEEVVALEKFLYIDEHKFLPVHLVMDYIFGIWFSGSESFLKQSKMVPQDPAAGEGGTATQEWVIGMGGCWATQG